MTLLQLSDFWKDIALKHKDVNEFQIGTNFSSADGTATKYPLVYFELPYSINYPDLSKPTNVIQFSLSVFLTTKQDDIQDDNEAISLAKEIGDAIIQYAILNARDFVVTSANALSVREYSDDSVAGVRWDITVTIKQSMTPICVDFNSVFNG